VTLTAVPPVPKMTGPLKLILAPVLELVMLLSIWNVVVPVLAMLVLLLFSVMTPVLAPEYHKSEVLKLSCVNS